MGTETSPKLPVIDFLADLKPNTTEWESVKSKVFNALKEYGSFEAIFNKIPRDFKKETLSAIEKLFELPLETKLRNFSTIPYHGYVGQISHFPLLESLGFDDAAVPEKVDAIISDLWPEGNQDMSKILHSFTEQVSELDQMVRRMIMESLGLEKYMEEHINSTNYLLKVHKYQIPEAIEGQLGMPPHTDKNMITILLQNQVAAVEVQTKDGHWIRNTPHLFTVVIGDSLHAWVNGRLPATIHQVMISGNETRYSLGLHSTPKPGYLIKAPEEAIDEEYPQLYKPYDYIDLLHYYMDVGRNDHVMKNFCGV